MLITPILFEAYLKCSTKCFLRSIGESPTEKVYAEWFCIRNEVYHQDGINRLSEKFSQDKCVSDPLCTGDLKIAKWRLATNFVARVRESESNIHTVERTPTEGRGKNAQFVPIRFLFTNKLTQDDKLLLAFDAFVLSEMLGREVSFGPPDPCEFRMTLFWAPLKTRYYFVIARERKLPRQSSPKGAPLG